MPLSDILIEMLEYILIEKLLHILIEQLIYLCQSFYKYISISIFYHKHTTNAIAIVNKKHYINTTVMTTFIFRFGVKKMACE